MNYISNFIKGLAIGAGAILPGVSSGVICVIFGVYEKLLNAVLNFFKNIKENSKLLFPIGLGAIVGIVIFGKILKCLFLAYPTQTKFTFIGLIIGCIPSLFKKACSKQKFRAQFLFYLIISLVAGIFCVVLEKSLPHSSSVSSFNFVFLIIVGFLMSAGIIIPGVSNTLILMLIGVYDAYLASISSLYIPFLFPLGIGVFIGSFFFMKLTKFLLDNYYAQTFFSIIGFTIGSIFVLYPGFSFDINGIISIVSVLFGICISLVI